MASTKHVVQFKGEDANLRSVFRKISNDLRGIRRDSGTSLDPWNRKSLIAAQNARRVSRQLQAMRNRAISLRSTFSRLVTAMAGVGTTIVLMRTAAHTVVRFEKAMGEVLAITRATTSQFAIMRAEAQKLGATTMFTASQAAEGLKFLAMAGFSAGQATKSLRATLNLAQAGAMDLGTAADIASNILTAFRINAEGLNDVVDDLATVASRSNTSVVQLGDAMKYVSASASSYGISLQETSAAIGVLSDAGMQASMAGTGLRQVFIRIAGQSAAMRQGMAALGITFAEINPEVNSLQQILERFAQTSVTATQVSAMFGARAANAFNILMQGREKVRSLTNEMANNSGRAQEMADVMGNTLYGQLKKVQSAYEDFFQTLFQTGEVSNTIREALELVSGVLNQVSGKLAIFEDDSVTGWGEQVSETYQKVQTFIESATRLAETLAKVAIAFISIKLISFSAGIIGMLKPIGAFSLQILTAVGQLGVFSARAATAGLSSKKLSGSIAVTTATIKKNVSAVATSRMSLLKLRISKTQLRIANTLLGGSFTKLRSSIQRGNMSLGTNRIQTTLASLGMKSFSIATRGAAIAVTGLRTAIQALKYIIGSILGPLVVLMVIIDMIVLAWDFFGSSAEDGAMAAQRAVQQLTDEVEALKRNLDKAEFAIDIEKNERGKYTEKSDDGVKRFQGVEIKAIKDVSNLMEYHALLGLVDEELHKAARTAENLEDAISLANSQGDDGAVSALQAQKVEINEVISKLEEKKSTLEGMEGYVKQQVAAVKLKSAVDALAEATRKYNSIAEGEETINNYLRQKNIVDQLRLSIADLNDEERKRETREADQEVAKAKSDLRKTLDDPDADDKTKQRARNALNRAEGKRRLLNFSDNVTGVDRGDRETRARAELSSDQLGLLAGKSEELQELRMKIALDKPEDAIDVLERVKKLREELSEAGITTITKEDTDTSEGMLKAIKTTQNLLDLQVELNEALRAEEIARKANDAAAAGESTDNFDSQLENMGKQKELRERARARRDLNSNFAEESRVGTDILGNRLQSDKGDQRNINALAEFSGGFLGENFSISSGGFDQNIDKISEAFKKISMEYTNRLNEKLGNIDAEITGLEQKRLELQDQKINTQDPETIEGLEATISGLSRDIENALERRKGVSGIKVGGNADGESERSTVRLFAAFQQMFQGTGIMNTEIQGENKIGGRRTLKDITPEDIANSTDAQRVQLEIQLMEAGKAIFRKRREDLEADKNAEEFQETAEKATVSKNAEQIVKEIAYQVELQKTNELEAQKLEIQKQQVALNQLNEEKADLISVQPFLTTDEEKTENKARIADVDARAGVIKGDISEMQANKSARDASRDNSLKEMAERITDAILAIRGKNITEQDKQTQINAVIAQEKETMQNNALEAGGRAEEAKESENAVAEAKAGQKGDKMRSDFEKKERDARAQEAVKLAKDAEKDKTTGKAGVSSLAAIGGGGGVGGGSVQDQQLAVQQKTRDVLVSMLKVLETPEGFEGKKDALAQMEKKLTKDEKQAMNAEFTKLVQAARATKDPQKKAELRQQAQGVLDGFGKIAEKRNFAPEGQEAGGAGGAMAGAVGVRANMFGGDPMAKQAIIAARGKIGFNQGGAIGVAPAILAQAQQQGVKTKTMEKMLDIIATNTSSLKNAGGVVVVPAGGGVA